jgi:hypothetical protein
MGFLAAFAAGAELSRMTKPISRWRGAVYSICVVAIIMSGIWLAHTFELMVP